MGKKRGVLSNEERNYIERNVHDLMVEDIAKHLNRTPATIKKYIHDNNLVGSIDEREQQQRSSLKARLQNKAYWPEIQKQFDEDELLYFIDLWVGTMIQFEEDVRWTEELQLTEWISFKIHVNRCLKEQQEHKAEVTRLQKLLNQEYSGPEEERDVNKIVSLQQQLDFSKGSIVSYTKRHTDLHSQANKIIKDLKGTRDVRIKRIDDGKTSWIGFLRMLEDEGARRQIGREMELMRLAKDASRKKMAEYHQFEDGTLDQPFLSDETLITEE